MPFEGSGGGEHDSGDESEDRHPSSASLNRQ